MTKAKYDMAGKIAFVTGAGSGIGEAVTMKLAVCGATVYATDIDLESVKRVARAAEGDVLPFRLDVACETEVAAMLKEIQKQEGRLDYAVNNAGIGAVTGLIHETDIESWQRIMSINLDGAFFCMRHELSIMKPQGAGAIVNMASVLGHNAFPNSAAYVTSKHALMGLTKATALDYAPFNIRINAVCPAFINTPPVRANMDEGLTRNLESRHAMQRLGNAEEVAEMTVYLLSDSASFSTGGAFFADGGYNMQ